MADQSFNPKMSLDQLSAAAKTEIGSLASKVICRANGALPYDYVVPSGVYEELWDWDAFFVGLHLISENKADGIYLKNWCLNFLHFTEPDGQTPGGIRPWAGRDARLYHIKPLMGQRLTMPLCHWAISAGSRMSGKR